MRRLASILVVAALCAAAGCSSPTPPATPPAHPVALLQGYLWIPVDQTVPDPNGFRDVCLIGPNSPVGSMSHVEVTRLDQPNGNLGTSLNPDGKRAYVEGMSDPFALQDCMVPFVAVPVAAQGRYMVSIAGGNGRVYSSTPVVAPAQPTIEVTN